ncbi:response regulator transcription factor [Actinocorallia longicatena]|uniref:Response regulator transcription factor n=1 Tax=Actinocorallia longicatena TaxID=111803 RepID=A0ABP6QK82_9ACTN
MNPPLRVLIADDQTLLRASLQVLLDGDGFAVAGTAADGEQAVELALRERPDVVLMDVRMPGTDGITATERIVAADPAIKIIILTTFDLDEYVFEGLRAGASGFLLKDCPPEELIAAIRIVARGDALLAPAVTRRIISRFTARPARTRRPVVLAPLTDREREILELIARGRSNAELGAELFLSVSTIKTHVSSLLSKLGARDRAQLVIIAYEAGVVSPAS